MRTEPYFRGEDDAAWDELVSRSPNGTFLHTRKYLAYHGDRFNDCSFRILNEKGGLIGVFPAADDPAGGKAVSHPGLTYGGIVHSGELRGEAMIRALQLIIDELQGGVAYRILRYKSVPSIYHAPAMQDDLYALFRLKARRVRCDLSATVFPGQRLPLPKGRVQGLRKAQDRGVSVRECPVQEFWPVLEESLAARHDAKPVHSLEEMLDLQGRFTNEIRCWGVFEGRTLLAGAVLYHAGPVDHCQYIASSEAGYNCSALDALFDELLRRSGSAGRIFDFGTSNEQQGWVLNENLYWFKRSFGAGGVAYETYEIDIPPLDYDR